VSEYRVSPMPVILGAEEYPKDCNEAIKKKNKKAIIFNAINFAKEAGNIRTANVVILGVVAKQIKDIKKDEWLEIIKKEVPPKTIESNLKAFNNGWEFQEGD
ncbi:MAG: 2-oxoacid:acceptor oxidoreductase family protein, partial [Actinomycetia bacterium]|nr:2-oxoacid:acceptor oxidoreductase family protein [Actinomycetes bacterium]